MATINYSYRLSWRVNDFEKTIKFSLWEDNDNLIVKVIISKVVSVEMSFPATALSDNPTEAELNLFYKKAIRLFHLRVKDEAITHVKLISIKK